MNKLKINFFSVQSFHLSFNKYFRSRYKNTFFESKDLKTLETENQKQLVILQNRFLQMFFKTGALKNFAILKECWILLLLKDSPFKKRLTYLFSCEYCVIFKNT